MHDSLELRLGYRVTELDESVQPALERRDELATAALDWRPVDAVGVLLTAQQRDSSEGSTLLSSSDSLALQAVTEIFPDLVLNSTLGVADTVDNLFDFTQETRYVVESFEARPNDRWLLNGSLSRYEYDSVGRVDRHVADEHSPGRLVVRDPLSLVQRRVAGGQRRRRQHHYPDAWDGSGRPDRSCLLPPGYYATESSRRFRYGELQFRRQLPDESLDSILAGSQRGRVPGHARKMPRRPKLSGSE